MTKTKQGMNLRANFFWQLFIEITNMLLPLITSPILARRLGAEALGIHAYVFNITSYFVAFAALGMLQYGTREIAMVRDDRVKRDEKFTELFFAQLMVGGTVTAAFVGYTLLFSRYPLFFLIEILSILGSSVLMINWLFLGMERFQTAAINQLITRLLSVVLIIFFVRDSSDLLIYFCIMVAEPMVGALMYLVLIRGKVKLARVSLRQCLGHVQGMFLVFIPVFTTQLYSSMDKLMLGRMSTMPQLAFYENATKALIAKNLATALSVALTPRMSNLVGKDDKKQFGILLHKSVEVVFLLTVAFGFGTAAVADLFSVVFWGEEFARCGGLIAVMSLTLPAYGVTYVINNQYLVPMKKEKIYIRATAAGVVVNFILNFLLIPKYHAMGAAIATLVTQYAVLVIEALAVRKDFSLPRTLRSSWVYPIFGLIMVMAVRLLETCLSVSVLGLLLEVMAGAGVFLVLCLGYWYLTGNREYLGVLEDIISKVLRRKKSQ